MERRTGSGPLCQATKCNKVQRSFRLGAQGLMLQSMDQTPHILVVDDDREIRDLLARFLEKQRIRVTAVRDGKEAKRAWLNGHYQLVVLDLMLPGDSGLDLAQMAPLPGGSPDRHAHRNGGGDRPHHRPGTWG